MNGLSLLDQISIIHDYRQSWKTSYSLADILFLTITAIIGGAYGVNDELRERADKTVSLSPLVFPHQLVRLILTEQLYRSQEIAAGRPYHHK